MAASMYNHARRCRIYNINSRGPGIPHTGLGKKVVSKHLHSPAPRWRTKAVLYLRPCDRHTAAQLGLTEHKGFHHHPTKRTTLGVLKDCPEPMWSFFGWGSVWLGVVIAMITTRGSKKPKVSPVCIPQSQRLRPW